MVTFMKKLSTVSAPKSLKYMLHSHLSGPEPARPLKNVHASALTKNEGFCPRYYALHDKLKLKPKNEWITAADTLTYDMGNDTQDRIVNWFADMNKAIGHWKCRACDTIHQFCARPTKCKNCGCKGFAPEEVRFESAISGASCGVDMLVNIGEDKLLPVELKTMGKDQFVTLAAPLAEHRLRTNLYLRLISESDHSWSTMVNTKRSKVLYVCKAGYIEDPELKKMGLSDKYSPFKEFDIVRKDSDTDELSKRAKVVKDFRAGEVPMPCGLCPTAMSVRAKWCSVKAQCFSGDYPPEYDWSSK